MSIRTYGAVFKKFQLAEPSLGSFRYSEETYSRQSMTSAVLHASLTSDVVLVMVMRMLIIMIIKMIIIADLHRHLSSVELGGAAGDDLTEQRYMRTKLTKLATSIIQFGPRKKT